MKKEKVKQVVKKSTMTLRLEHNDVLTLDKLKTKLSINVGSKALMKAAELIVKNDYEFKITQLNNDVILWKRLFYKVMTAVNDRQNIEKTLSSYIGTYLPEITKEIEEIDRLKGLEKPISKYVYVDEINKSDK